MFGQTNWLIILVTSNALQVLGQKDTSVTRITLPVAIVSNMEVLNKDALYQLITDWLKQRTYANTAITWLLGSELCFEHPLQNTDKDKLDSETVQFLDTVPFEEVLSHTYNYGDTRTLTAVNKTLVSAYIQAFSLHGYSAKVVVPAKLIQPSDVLTSNTAKLVYKKENDLEKNSLIAQEAANQAASITTLSSGSTQQSTKSQLPLLLTIFTILLAILGFVIYLNQ